MNPKLLLAALVLIGAVSFGIYRYLHPNVIHGVVVCGQVFKGGEPYANQKAELFTFWGGERYELENGKLKDSGSEDRSRALREITLDSQGKFCLDKTVLKYYYKLGQFQVLMLQAAKAHREIIPGAKAPPEPAAEAVEGVILTGEIDQKAEILKIDAVFDLEPKQEPTLSETGGAYGRLFNNQERLKAKQAPR